MQESNNNTQTASTSSLGLSVAIVIAAIIIGGAVVYTNKNNPAPIKQQVRADDPHNVVDGNPIDISDISPVTAADHIRGSLDAKIKIVEYSDTECPFCVRLHFTLHQLIKESPDVAWVYRHMPLEGRHKRAVKEAVATECVAELGGEEKFWEYLDMIYTNTPGNDGLDPALLSTYAVAVGVEKSKFDTCLTEMRHVDKVKKQIAEGSTANHNATGNSIGTPFSVIITPTGEYLPVFGAQPLELWRNVVEYILEQK